MVEVGVKGREVGIGSGAGRTGAERGEPCRVFELLASRFIPELRPTGVESGVGFEQR